jgi:hypothetical protein
MPGLNEFLRPRSHVRGLKTRCFVVVLPLVGDFRISLGVILIWFNFARVACKCNGASSRKPATENPGLICVIVISERGLNIRVKCCCRLDVKGCKQNLSSNIPTRNRSSSNAFQLAPYTSSPRGILERRTSQTPASTLKIVRSVSRESVRSIHHCTCPCLNAPVR